MDEREKKVYKRGDNVSFRLVKRKKYDDSVLDLINDPENNLNHIIIDALQLYSDYKQYQSIVGITNTQEFFKTKAINDNVENILIDTEASKEVNQEDLEEKFNDENVIPISIKELGKNKPDKIDNVEVAATQSNYSSEETAADELFDDQGTKQTGIAKAFSSMRIRR